jgi:Tfp pilus assembly protein PilO
MNEKRITIITIACLVVLLGALGGAYYYFHLNKLQQLEAELEQVRAAVADAEQKKAKIEPLKKQIEGLIREEEKLAPQIPNLGRDEYDTLANLLDDLRRRSGVIVPQARWVTATRPQPVPGRPARTIPPSVHKVQFDLSVSGSFFQLLRYINLLEQQSRFINVESFQIQPAQGQGAEVALRRNMRVTVYSYTYRQAQEPVFEISEQRYGRSTDIPD